MRKLRFILFLLVSGGLCLSPMGLSAQTLTGQEIMDKVYQTPKPKTTNMTMSMVISKNGQSLSRTLALWSSGDNVQGEAEKSLMKFLAPGDIKGAGFLAIKKVDGPTVSLLWLPAMGKVRRLSASNSDQDSAFFGSDFTNRDINGYNKTDFSYDLIGQANGQYLVEAKPKKDAGYDKLIYTIDAASFTKSKIEYYKAGKLVKAQTVTYTENKGYVLPAEIIMTASSGSTTSLKFTDYKLDLSIGDLVFTERFLRQ